MGASGRGTLTLPASPRNQPALNEFALSRAAKVGQMTFGYVQPFSFKIVAPPAIKVASVRHGVTEITLSDGRLVRATLHIKDVKPSAQKPGSLNISYNVVAEVMATPSVPILDVHETVQ
jgi:hypothetical protein